MGGYCSKIGSDMQILYPKKNRERADKRQEQAGAVALLLAPHAFARDMSATDAFCSSSVYTHPINCPEFNHTESVPYFAIARVVVAAVPQS